MRKQVIVKLSACRSVDAEVFGSGSGYLLGSPSYRALKLDLNVLLVLLTVRWLSIDP